MSSDLLGDVLAEIEFDSLGLLQAAFEEAAHVIRVLRAPPRAPDGGQSGCEVPRRDRGGRVDELLRAGDRGLVEAGDAAGEGVDEVVQLVLGKNAVELTLKPIDLGSSSVPVAVTLS